MLKEILEKNGYEVIRKDYKDNTYSLIIVKDGKQLFTKGFYPYIPFNDEEAKTYIYDKYVIENGFDEDWLENHYKSNGWTYDISKGTDCDWYISIRNKEKLANICYFLRITNGKLLDSSNLKLVALLYAKGIKINLKGGE